MIDALNRWNKAMATVADVMDSHDDPELARLAKAISRVTIFPTPDVYSALRLHRFQNGPDVTADEFVAGLMLLQRSGFWIAPGDVLRHCAVSRPK